MTNEQLKMGNGQSPMSNKEPLREFLYNNVRVKLVGQDPETGIAFYVNDGVGGVIGIRVYPDGRKVQVNSSRVDWVKKHGKAVYLLFKDAFGHHKNILASRAVYIAWVGAIDPDKTIDHINGCTTDNRFFNLRQVSGAINSRDGGFLRKLKGNCIDPVSIDRTYLLRYFERMAKLKAQSPSRYKVLDKPQLLKILYASDEEFQGLVAHTALF